MSPGLRRLYAPASNQGLTLVELLVSLSVLGAVALLLASALSGMRRATDGLLDRGVRLDDPAAALRDFAREIEGVCDPNLPDLPPFEFRAGKEPENEIWLCRFFSARPDPESDDPARFDLLEIRYAARKEADGVRLLRSERPVRDEFPEELPPLQWRAARLRSIRMEIGDGEKWLDHWPVDSGTPLPRRVRIRVETGGETDPELIEEILVPASIRIRKNRKDIPG
ncbi:MAG: prepilin-type N-terminal cleavage/methylation domain-containing protein [Kiritimatiellia bacterium]|nr:prepilin-type N-terminal cleavage/methylation domain-containing protein [Kiritimatiellia bacterium]